MRRALIVDDSSVIRKIVTRVLSQADLGFEEIVEAGNGQEGMDALRKQWFDVILCDINMPVMDGLEMLRQVQEQSLAAYTAIVMLTTEGSEQHVRTSIEYGACSFIRKPFSPEIIKERIMPLLK